VTAPYPGAFTSYRGRRLVVWWARPLDVSVERAVPGEVVETRNGAGVVVATGAGSLLVERVELEAGRIERADEMAARLGFGPGARLGEAA
jgi:methionyl-tRNA formyltransferase